MKTPSLKSKLLLDKVSRLSCAKNKRSQCSKETKMQQLVLERRKFLNVQQKQLRKKKVSAAEKQPLASVNASSSKKRKRASGNEDLSILFLILPIEDGEHCE